MCGMAGVINFGGPSDRSLVREMLRPIHHRGPDGWGLFASGGVAFGHVRLSIVDLTVRGAQPMTRGALTITYNGEIYNFVELRSELAKLGHVFSSNTDTEVVLAAYAAWGESCVQRFEGMWALAIHDADRQVVFCSRDRFGMKPFLYLVEGGRLVFGSELAQFQKTGLATEPCMASVHDFLVFGSSLRPQSSFLDGVCSLPSGHNLVIDCASGELRLDKYYKVGPSAEFAGLSEQEYGEVLRSEFDRTVRRHLRSDVQVGVLLSGGVDSSLVAAVAAPLYLDASGDRLRAFTATSGDSRNDETGYARKVAHAAQLDWSSVPVTTDVTTQRWAEATEVIQQPLADSSHVMQLEVMRGAREAGCTVLLDGQGADESWMGYERYAVAAMRDTALRERPAFARQSARHMGISPARWAAMWGYFSWSAIGATRTRWRFRKLGLPLDRDWFDASFGMALVGGGSRIELQQKELQGAQLGGLLRYADLTSMHFSLEDRLPFLDHRLVELAVSLPTKLLFCDGWTKYPLRKYLQGLVPESVAWRRRKIGFEAPRVAFSLTDPEVADTVRRSRLLQELGIDGAELHGIPQVVAWRLYAIALWESVSLSV